MSEKNISFSPELSAALKRCDVLVGKDTLEYYYNLYDPATGGFYYSISSRDAEKMTPFAEGTRFVLESLLDGGLTLPDWYKEKVSAWILPHQDPADGYFYEDLWGKNTAGPRKDRDLTYSADILTRMCGVQPLYPLPQERIRSKSGNASLPEYLAGEREMRAYLDSLDWSVKSIWGTGQKLSSAVSLITAAGLYDFVHDYVKAKQNPDTGLWGEGLGWMNTNGAMKLSAYFRDPAHPYPRMETMIESVLRICQGDVPPTSATWIWNPFVALNNALHSMGENAGEMREKLLCKGADIVNAAIDNAMLLKRADGGFASGIHRATPTQQGYLFGYGLAEESDMDGTVIAGQRLRATIHSVFGACCSHDYYREYEEEFWHRLRTKPPVTKTLPPPVKK